MPRPGVFLLFQEKIQKVTDFTKSCASLTETNIAQVFLLVEKSLVTV
jgi:hypothetical protein